ncbi:MAG: helix-turn-helix transcriptional regulator [Nitrospiraceae bacterium]|nr:helix-turn-helix transcriptional regulator [Nitrospiraceae bacterium]MDO9118985.1 helix-turn-helix transcriptional regulator [Nitrospira sp.]
MKYQPTASDARIQSLVADVFGGLSREELLMALSLMHQILEADRERDMARIMTALSELRRETTGTKLTPRKTPNENRAGGTTSLRGNYSPRVVRYLFSCLTKIQTRLDVEPNHPHGPGNTCHLSPRELTVLLWMKEGKTNWEIAQILGLSERTVRFHVGGIFEKLDVTSRTQAVARALGAGLIAS